MLIGITASKLALAIAFSAAMMFGASYIARQVLLNLSVNALCKDLATRSMSLKQNAFGFALIILGIALLFLPGPGLLLIAVGLFSCEFPGRTKLLRVLLKKPRIFEEVNALRTRHGRPPLALPKP
jgi:O-antigen/teichoic acid export membrane protein